MIHKAAELFGLDSGQAEALANSAGLSLNSSAGSLMERLNYSGKPKDICAAAGISERMLRSYKNKIPTKQALLAIVIALELPIPDIDRVLRSYGYCLFDSIAADVVVKWCLENSTQRKSGAGLLNEINDVLDKMGLPLLMTRLK